MTIMISNIAIYVDIPYSMILYRPDTQSQGPTLYYIEASVIKVNVCLRVLTWWQNNLKL